ncbi:hypothetical protein MNV49_005804 [Pseudohyphozyma bogoriensis]|nr:hypothetical protein MNV49_005804 [Pseudohyphozyma bogoriensis]
MLDQNQTMTPDPSEASTSPSSPPSSDLDEATMKTLNEMMLAQHMINFCRQSPASLVQQLASDKFAASTGKHANRLEKCWFRYYDKNVRGNPTAIQTLYTQSLTLEGCAEIVDLVIAFIGPPSRSRGRSKRKEGELREKLLRRTVE